MYTDALGRCPAVEQHPKMNTPVEMQSLNTLLYIEDDEMLLDFKCATTGLPLWPLIRTAALRTVLSDWLFQSTPLVSTRRDISVARLAKNLAFSAIHNYRHGCNRRASVIIQNTGLGAYMHNGSVSDRLVSYFAGELPDRTFIYQDKPKDSFRQKHSFDQVRYKLPRDVLNQIYARLAVRSEHRNLAGRMMTRVKESALKNVKYEFSSERIKNLTSSLARSVAALPYISDFYAKWFAKAGFKLLLKEDACYGASAIPIIHAARLNGVTVAEYQHGVISKGHDAYNFSNLLCSLPSYQKVLPDYLLTYGRWWSNQTNAPVKKIAVGNPHLSETLRELGDKNEEQSHVLILGDGIETGLYLDLSRQVVEIASRHGMKVVFRPHPLELDRVSGTVMPSGVTLDDEVNIYSALQKSSFVISELSTGLFEAVGLAGAVILWETRKSRFAFPDLPFPSFENLVELESIFQRACFFQQEISNVPAVELWEPDWRRNYLSFVRGIIG